MENTNDTFLSDWLANKISDNQLKQLVSDEDFLAYQKLKNVLGNYTIQQPDLEQNYGKIQEKIVAKNPTKQQSKVYSLWKYVAVAASLLLFFGLYQVFYFSNTVSTDYGLTKIIILKDNSKVTLNSKSELSYPNFFNWNRTLKLNGEAFFEVQKGSKFTVETELGTVSVLGTKFNITSFDDYFEVVCFDGKVMVVKDSKKVILTKGESVRIFEKSFENWVQNSIEKPQWISGESSFKNVPMKYVIDKFEMQFNTKIMYPKDIDALKFTGSFSNKNIETAIKSICIPLNLNYTINKGNIILTE